MVEASQGWVKRRERYGDLGLRRSFAERFEALYTPEPNSGCWLWLGTREQNGYGRVSLRHKNVGAHRASWELFKGPIPSGMLVLHRCDVRSCVNPDHLFLGAHDENMDDMTRKGRQCRGEAFHTAKLTENDVRKIFADPRRKATIAREYGVTGNNIACIKAGKTWKHVTGGAS